MSAPFEPPNPQTGFAARARSWRELLPWMRLADALQPSLSLVALLLSLAAYWLANVGVEWLERFAPTDAGLLSAAPVARLAGVLATPEWAGDAPTVPRVLLYFVEPLSRALSEPPGAARFGVRLLQQLWLWLVWMIPAGYLLRQTLLHTAGRMRMATVDAVRFIARRPAGMLGGPSLPLAALALIAVYFVVLGAVSRVPGVGAGIATGLGWLGLPLVLLAGLLVVGLGLAFPLIWSAAVAEEYADGFDTASRGFEYLYQRTLRFFAYYLLATGVALVVTTLVYQIVHAGAQMLVQGVAWARGEYGWLPPGLLPLLDSLPDVYAINLFWTLSAVIYLLLRRDANHQDIEDLWEPPAPAPEPLPDLPLEGEP